MYAGSDKEEEDENGSDDDHPNWPFEGLSEPEIPDLSSAPPAWLLRSREGPLWSRAGFAIRQPDHSDPLVSAMNRETQETFERWVVQREPTSAGIRRRVVGQDRLARSQNRPIER